MEDCLVVLTQLAFSSVEAKSLQTCRYTHLQIEVDFTRVRYWCVCDTKASVGFVLSNGGLSSAPDERYLIPVFVRETRSVLYVLLYVLSDTLKIFILLHYCHSILKDGGCKLFLKCGHDGRQERARGARLARDSVDEPMGFLISALKARVKTILTNHRRRFAHVDVM